MRGFAFCLLFLLLPMQAAADTVSIHRAEDRVAYEQGKVRAEPLVGAETSEIYLGRLTLAPGAIVPPHRHEDSDETLTILSGEGVIQRGDEAVRVGPGDTIRIPRTVLHDFAVAGTQAVEAIQVYSPRGPDARFREWPAASSPGNVP